MVCLNKMIIFVKLYLVASCGSNVDINLQQSLAYDVKASDFDLQIEHGITGSYAISFIYNEQMSTSEVDLYSDCSQIDLCKHNNYFFKS